MSIFSLSFPILKHLNISGSNTWHKTKHFFITRQRIAHQQNTPCWTPSQTDLRHNRLWQLKRVSQALQNTDTSAVCFVLIQGSLKIKFDKKVLHYGSILPSLLTKNVWSEWELGYHIFQYSQLHLQYVSSWYNLPGLKLVKWKGVKGKKYL